MCPQWCAWRQASSFETAASSVYPLIITHAHVSCLSPVCPLFTTPPMRPLASTAVRSEMRSENRCLQFDGMRPLFTPLSAVYHPCMYMLAALSPMCPLVITPTHCPGVTHASTRCSTVHPGVSASYHPSVRSLSPLYALLLFRCLSPHKSAAYHPYPMSRRCMLLRGVTCSLLAAWHYEA